MVDWSDNPTTAQLLADGLTKSTKQLHRVTSYSHLAQLAYARAS